MRGIDQRFRHYPQLCSRLGLSHRPRTHGRETRLVVLDRQGKPLGRTLGPEDFTDTQAIATIERIASGAFGLVERWLPQIVRVLKINPFATMTDDVIEGAAIIPVHGQLTRRSDRRTPPRRPEVHVQTPQGSCQGLKPLMWVAAGALTAYFGRPALQAMWGVTQRSRCRPVRRVAPWRVNGPREPCCCRCGSRGAVRSPAARHRRATP